MASKGKQMISSISTPQMLSAQSAIYLLNDKIQKLADSHKLHMQAVECKFGEQDTYVTDNIPDMDLINKAISTINSRLLDLETLEARVSALEIAGGATKPAPKKRGTVKLELDEPGISFYSDICAPR